MASIARRVTCRDRGVLLAFMAGTAESFRTPSNFRRTGSFCAGPAVPPGAVHAHLVRSGSAMASATSFTPHSCSGTDAMRTPLGLGCIGHRHVGAMGAIRTMAAKKSTTKSSQRRRRKGKHGGKHDNDATSRTGKGTSRRRQTAKDRLRGVMKSYKAMIDGHDDDGADPGEATASHEDGGQRVPPAYLAATASPHAWIAASAADATGVDRGQLFAHGGGPPGSFRSARFEYCSPKAFGHELPEFSIPEVAFLGRSNVGKSSLINALTGTRDLARVSKRPGRTQQVNYFALLGGGGGGGGGKKSPRPAAARRAGGASSSPSSAAAAGAPFRPSDATGFLVDLPGFGYAAAPDDAVDEWQRTTMDFLLQRRDHGTMARVYLLVDGRHGATPLDLAVMEWFDEAEVPYTIVLTKTDASASRAGVIKHVNELCLRFTGRLHGGGGVFQGPVVHLTSARTGDGVEDLMWAIDGDFVGYCEGAEGAIVDSGKPRW